MPFDGLILDVDGTLVDSNDAHARAWVDAFAECGIDVPFARLRPLIGMGTDKLLPAAAGVEEDTLLGRALAARRGEIFRTRYLPTVRPFPGVPDLLCELRDDGFKLVVASSAEKEDLQRLLAVARAEWLLDAATSGDEAERSKPDPDVVHAALRKLALAPELACMLGDTPYDVAAATRAGVATIAFRCGGWDDAHLAGAIAIYDDPEDLRVHRASSPLARPAHRQG